MTKKEFAVFVAAMKDLYQKDKLFQTETALSVWYGALQDLDFETAKIALTKWAMTEKWSPSIAEIRSTAAEIVCGEVPDWDEEWEKVLKAIGRYGYYRQEEALASLPEMTRACVKRLGFANICMSENIAVERANFRTIFQQLAEREKRKVQMQPDLLAAIEAKRREVKRLEGG